MERRLKILEDDNPIALLESDINELIGRGKLINATSVNMVSNESSDLDTVFKDNGTLFFRFDVIGGAKEKRVFLKFEENISDFFGGVFLNIGILSLDFFTSSAGANLGRAAGINLTVSVVNDFDPDTLTWNNQPATTGVGETVTFRFSVTDTVASSVLTFKTGADVNLSWTVDFDGSATLFTNIANWAGPLRIDIAEAFSNTSYEASGTVTIDKNGLSSSSSFLIDTIPGSQVRCPTV